MQGDKRFILLYIILLIKINVLRFKCNLNTQRHGVKSFPMFHGIFIFYDEFQCNLYIYIYFNPFNIRLFPEIR